MYNKYETQRRIQLLLDDDVYREINTIQHPTRGNPIQYLFLLYQIPHSFQDRHGYISILRHREKNREQDRLEDF